MHLTALALHAIAASATAHSWAARIDAKDAPAIRAALDGGQPFVAAGALSPEACDAWTGDLMEGFGEAIVTQQIAGEPVDAPLAATGADAPAGLRCLGVASTSSAASRSGCGARSPALSICSQPARSAFACVPNASRAAQSSVGDNH